MRRWFHRLFSSANDALARTPRSTRRAFQSATSSARASSAASERSFAVSCPLLIPSGRLPSRLVSSVNVSSVIASTSLATSMPPWGSSEPASTASEGATSGLRLLLLPSLRSEHPASRKRAATREAKACPRNAPLPAFWARGAVNRRPVSFGRGKCPPRCRTASSTGESACALSRALSPRLRCCLRGVRAAK